MKKIPIILIILLVAVTFLAGCISISVYTRVDADGMIDQYRQEVTTNAYVYSLLETSANQSGYSSVEEYWKEEGTASGDIPLTYREDWDNDNVTMVFESVEPFSPDRLEDVTITKTDGYLVFEQKSEAAVSDENLTAGLEEVFEISYYLEMPGPIVESNADLVEENNAEWHYNTSGYEGYHMYAKSELPTSIPGFGMICAIAAGLIACALITRKRKA
jgi:hypothetical protein